MCAGRGVAGDYRPWHASGARLRCRSWPASAPARTSRCRASRAAAWPCRCAPAAGQVGSVKQQAKLGLSSCRALQISAVAHGQHQLQHAFQNVGQSRAAAWPCRCAPAAGQIRSVKLQSTAKCCYCPQEAGVPACTSGCHAARRCCTLY